MDFLGIKEKIENREVKALGIKHNYAVFLPILEIEEQLHILYEVRAFDMDIQPGEISFPGGEVEKGEIYKDAAVRETIEELGISRDKISIIGELDYIISPYNFILKPFAGVLSNIELKDLNLNKSEVNHVFTVPIRDLMDFKPSIYYANISPEPEEDFPYHMIPKGENYDWRRGRYPIYFYKYKDYIIWGMTAAITKNFIDIIKGTIQ